MESMILGYPPEQAGQICVTATKEEWAQVAERLYHFRPHPEDAGDILIDLLTDWGV